jgi:hypothetical protein
MTTNHHDDSIARAAVTLNVKREVIQRAVELGAIVPDADGTISDAELMAFINRGFKNHRYDKNGNKLPGVKS